MSEKKALVGNAADEKQVKRASNKEQIKRENELLDIKSVLSTFQGRRLLYRIINNLCHYDTDEFNHTASITFKNLGEHNIGRTLKSDCCEASLSLYQQAERENWEFIKGEKNVR